MKRITYQTPAILVAAFAAVLSLQGCASSKSSLSDARDAKAANDAAFDAGANRPPNAKTLYSMAKILESQGRDRDAIRLLMRITEQTPSFLPAYNEVAGIYMRSDRVEDAVSILSTGLKQAPNDSVLHNNIGMCRFVRGDYETALASFQQAVKGMPDNGTFRANEAAALGMLGRSDEAAATYQGAMNPRDVATNIEVLRSARLLANPKPVEAGPPLLDQLAPATQPATTQPASR